MNIRDLVYDLVVEEVKNKKQFQFLLNKWYGENPTPEQIETADKMLTVFMQKQKGLEVSNPPVYSFLTRFDGTYPNEYPIFDPKNLKDSTHYTLPQMKFLYNELRDDDDLDQEGVFSGDNYSNLDKVSASYNLWKGDEHKIIDEGSLRVYYIPNEKVAKQFGYYMQAVTEWDGSYLQRTSPETFTQENKKLIPHVGVLNGAQWCVTGRGTSDSRGNMWGNYRDSRTFYFVIDESKAPSSELEASVSRYYLGALQVTPSIREGYYLTSALNDRDQEKTWEELVKIYPLLAEHKDKLVTVKFVRNEELENGNDIVARINENSDNINEFRRVDKRLKKAYLDRGGVISKSESWRSMPEKLRQYYIMTTTARNALDKYQTTSLLNEIRKKGVEFNLLNKRLKTVGFEDGINHIYNHLIQEEFRVARVSLDNPKIVFFNSKPEKTKHLFGLYNKELAKWVQHDGVTFEPHYTLYDNMIYVDDEETEYLVEIYVGESKQIGNDTLYCLYPIIEINEFAKGHFIGHKKWEMLSSKIHPKDEDNEDDDDTIKFSNLDPETDVDIKEIY
jgi:hypothetical protein